MSSPTSPFSILLYSALIIGISAHSNHATSQSSDSWAFVTDDEISYQARRSIDAQNGESVLEIDGTMLSFPIEFQQKHQYWSAPSRPSGYVVQTISAAPYVAKHLHISGFARGVKPNFAKLEKKFSDYYQGAQKVRLNKLLTSVSDADQDDVTEWFIEDNEGLYEEKLVEFRTFIRDSYDNSDYGIAVVLDMGDGKYGERDLRFQGPTSTGAPRLNEFWNRFNVEVSIPQGCQSISIVLWQRGVTISQFDYLAISEQGDPIQNSGSRFYLEATPVYEIIAKSRDLSRNFSNLSFE